MPLGEQQLARGLEPGFLPRDIGIGYRPPSVRPVVRKSVPRAGDAGEAGEERHERDANDTDALETRPGEPTLLEDVADRLLVRRGAADRHAGAVEALAVAAVALVEVVVLVRHRDGAAERPEEKEPSAEGGQLQRPRDARHSALGGPLERPSCTGDDRLELEEGDQDDEEE